MAIMHIRARLHLVEHLICEIKGTTDAAIMKFSLERFLLNPSILRKRLSYFVMRLYHAILLRHIG